jgi:putative ABC transport system permease protein
MFTGVSPGYFDTMGLTLLAGRNINRDDTPGSERVAVVNQAFVKAFCGGQSPTGQTLLTSKEPGYPATVYRIVGVAGDTHYSDIRDKTPPMEFVPASQYPTQGPWTDIMIRSKLPSATVAAAVKRSLSAKHPELTMEFIDFQRRIRDGLVRERLMAMLAGFFGALAAMLAAIGLYRVMSYRVARRRNEIGIRMALGAGRGRVVAMVVREAAILLGSGMAVGLILAVVARTGREIAAARTDGLGSPNNRYSSSLVDRGCSVGEFSAGAARGKQ